MRKLEVHFEALALAPDDHSREALDYYFDTRTGDVIEMPMELIEELEFDDAMAAEDLDG